MRRVPDSLGLLGQCINQKRELGIKYLELFDLALLEM